VRWIRKAYGTPRRNGPSRPERSFQKQKRKYGVRSTRIKIDEGFDLASGNTLLIARGPQCRRPIQAAIWGIPDKISDGVRVVNVDHSKQIRPLQLRGMGDGKVLEAQFLWGVCENLGGVKAEAWGNRKQESWSTTRRCDDDPGR